MGGVGRPSAGQRIPPPPAGRPCNTGGSSLVAVENFRGPGSTLFTGFVTSMLSTSFYPDTNRHDSSVCSVMSPSAPRDAPLLCPCWLTAATSTLCRGSALLRHHYHGAGQQHVIRIAGCGGRQLNVQRLGTRCPGALHCLVGVGWRQRCQCLVATAPCCDHSGRHLTRGRPHCFVATQWQYIGCGCHCCRGEQQRVN